MRTAEMMLITGTASVVCLMAAVILQLFRGQRRLSQALFGGASMSAFMIMAFLSATLMIETW